MTPAWTKLRPHDIQRKLWTSPQRFVAVPAGRGSGKTELAKRRLVRYLPVLHKHEWKEHSKYFYGAPTQEQANRIAWEHLRQLIPPQWIKHQDDIKKSEHLIRCTFNTHIADLFVVGLDKPQRIEGLQYDGCVIDESCDIKPLTFALNILPTLGHRKGWCWRIGVPKRRGVGAQEFRELYEKYATGKVLDAMGFTWFSRGIVPDDEIEWALENLDAKDFREQYEAQFETAGGGIFDCFDREYNVRPCSYKPEKAVCIGMDFNVNPMSWVLMHDYKGYMEVFDEIWKRHTNTVECLNILWGRYATHKGGFRFYGDATSKARKTSASRSDFLQIHNDERFQGVGRTIHFPDSNPAVLDRFAATNRMLCTARGDRKLFIDAKCEQLIRDLESRFYKAELREPDDKGDLGHMTDALGYAIYYIYPITMHVTGKMTVGSIVG